MSSVTNLILNAARAERATCDSQLSAEPWEVDQAGSYGPGTSRADRFPASAPQQGLTDRDFLFGVDTPGRAAGETTARDHHRGGARPGFHAVRRILPHPRSHCPRHRGDRSATR